MIDKIIEFSVRNRIVISIMVAIIVLWGAISYQQLPIDAVPDISNTQVGIVVVCPNLSPIEAERFLTTPIELAMSTIPGVEDVRAVSRFGLSNVTLIFKDGVDIYWARQQVSEKIREVEEELPKEFGRPQMLPITTGLGEVYQYVLETDNPDDTSYSLLELRTIQDWIVRKKLMGVEGVVEISSFGGYKKEFQAQIDPERLRSQNVTIDEVFDALARGNGNTGGAYIEKDNRAFLIRGIGLANSVEDLENTVIKENNGSPVLIKDIAQMKVDGALRYGAMVKDGKKEVVGAVVMMQLGYNASQVISKLKDRIAQVEKELPKGLKIKPFIDREELVTNTINTVWFNLMEGAIIVLFILILFLGDWRASLISASLIPLSLLFAFILMNQVGVIGNLMSLGALDFGLIVDGSVIIVESMAIVVTLRIRQMGAKMSYYDRQELVIETMREVKKSVFFGSLIILIVYMPLLSLAGIEGKTFRPLCLTVMFAVIGALLLSITYVPMMCALVMNHAHKKNNFSDRMVNWLYARFRPLIVFGLRQKAVVIAGVVVALISGVWAFGFLGGEFMPTLDEGGFAIETRLPVGTSFTQTIRTVKQIQAEILKTYPDEIVTIVGKVGTSEVPTDPMPLEACDLIVMLHPKKQWKKVHTKNELADGIAQVCSHYPGVEISIQQPIQMRFNEILSGAKTDIVFTLYGYDLREMNQIAGQILEIAADIEGTADIQMQKIFGMGQINITYDRKNMALYGITVQQINDLIETAFAGKKAGYLYDEDRKYDITVRLPQIARNNSDAIGNLLLRNSQGTLIPLREVASITTDVGPTEIRHLGKQRAVNIGANIRGRDMQSVVMEADKKIKEKITLPFGYRIEYGGAFENFERATARLGVLVPLALFIILVLLYMAFGNFKDSILIFTAVPMSAIGGIWGLFLRDITFSISAGVGFIALFGVSVLNGIMLVSHFKFLEKEGFRNPHDVVMRAVVEKFRAILMTSAVAALGFLPMAIASGAGADVQKPLATVVIFGLILSTFMTLIVIPVLYVLFGKMGSFRKSKAAVTTVIVGLLVVSASPKAEAQTTVSAQQAAQRALSFHPAVQKAKLEVKRESALKNGAINPPNVEVLYENYKQGSSTSVLATMDFPTGYYYKYQAQKGRVTAAEHNVSATQNELLYRVITCYLDLQHLTQREQLLTRQDSIFSALVSISEARYRTGQIGSLEKLNSEARYRLLQNQLLQTRAELRGTAVELQRLMGMSADSLPTPAFPLQRISQQSNYAATDTAWITQNPVYRWYGAQAQAAQNDLRAQRSQWLPGLIAGYSVGAAEGPRVGISIPLFFWSQAAYTKAAKTQCSIMQQQVQNNALNLNTNYQQAVATCNAMNESLLYFEQTGRAQSAAILAAAHASFRSGAIGYFVYLQNIDQCYTLDLSYLETLHNYNHAVLQLWQITGQLSTLSFNF